MRLRDGRAAGPLAWHIGMLGFGLLLVVAIDNLVHAVGTTVGLIPVLTAVALFVLIFIRFAVTPMASFPHAERWIAALAVIGFALAAVSPGETLFLTTTAALSGLYLPPRRAAVAIVSLTASIVTFAAIAGRAGGDLAGLAVQSTALAFFCFGWARLTETNRALDLAQREVARLAVADERVRFARDLHDLLGHTLSVIRIKSELAAKLADTQPERARAEMIEVESVARSALAEVRETVSGYRPRLAVELANADAALTQSGIRAELDAEPLEVTGPAAETLAWVVREATTNVVRHSQAATCRIRLHTEGDRVRLEISDDGCGATPGREGNGLRGMRERVEAIGGLVVIDREIAIGGRAAPGFRLQVTVPSDVR